MLYEVITHAPCESRRPVHHQDLVITSYSIHYTKLYDDRSTHLLERLTGNATPVDLPLDEVHVITSYSIHYTKLYDMFTANSMNCLTEAVGMGLPGNGTIPAVMSARIRLAKA